MYTEALAARLLGVPQSTLHYWLEGGTRGGKEYKPIIRQEPLGRRVVTWAEFVEAGWLSEYRNRNIPMPELRKFIDELRDQFGVPYPLADRRPLVAGRSLVYDAQTSAQLGVEFYYVDADVLGLAHVLAQLRSDVTYPGDPGATIHKRERPHAQSRRRMPKDTEWIPVVGTKFAG